MPDTRPLRSGDPTVLGEYELLGRLGEGGQGAVFLGRRAGAGAPERASDFVAVKLLHSGLAGDDSARSRFVRELAVAKRVARFCTAQVLDADVAGDQPYIVSEFVPGQSLHRLVQVEGPRTGGALERLAISTLTALYAIHQAGIVHRDFKPHNVMMGPDGPRVIDFGVARALNAAGETQNVGTPAYMAPEHFTGGPVGPASDMFAWGTTMVFAATGRPAFGNDDMAAVMHRILTGEPDLGDLPEPLRGVVADCLAKEPERRPTAREAQERLVGAAPGAVPGAPAVAPAPQVPAHAAPVPAPFAAPAPPPASAAAHASGPAGPPPVRAEEAVTDPHAGGAADGRDAHGTTAPQPPPFPHPSPGRDHTHPGGPIRAESGRKRLLVPITVAAAVAALLAGGSVWAATRSGGGAHEEGSAAQRDGNAPIAVEKPPGAPDATPSQAPADPQNSRNPDGKPGGRNGQKPGPGGSPAPSPSSPPNSPRPEPRNTYTPQQVCNSGGHGGGYYVQRSMTVAGGRAYQLYNSSGYNCAVLIKTRNVGRPSPVSVWIQRQGGSKVSDSGSYSWYAGPVYVSAPGTCVRFGSGSAASPYGNCG